MKKKLTTTWTWIAAAVSIAALAGCGAGKQGATNRGFFTSGSRDADQRAEQRMAKSEQLAGQGEGTGERKVASKQAAASGGDKSLQATDKTTLYDRLGADKGIALIVDDFLTRSLADPRVNWERKGVTRGGFIRAGESVTWQATPDKVENLKKHVCQMLSIATGGPAHYDGLEMQPAHASLHISNAEFDACVGDLKASIDKLQVPIKEQKELIAIIESTRTQVVQER
jgi:hemoglobin